MSSPTQRTLAMLKKRGAVSQVVERWCQFSHKRVDLFGIIDIVACVDGRILGVQATSGDNVSKRLLKATEEPRLRAWLLCGGRFIVIGWRKGGAVGKRKLWSARIIELTYANGSWARKEMDVAEFFPAPKITTIGIDFANDRDQAVRAVVQDGKVIAVEAVS